MSGSTRQISEKVQFQCKGLLAGDKSVLQLVTLPGHLSETNNGYALGISAKNLANILSHLLDSQTFTDNNSSVVICPVGTNQG
jgi:hypothetical protein